MYKHLCCLQMAMVSKQKFQADLLNCQTIFSRGHWRIQPIPTHNKFHLMGDLTWIHRKLSTLIPYPGQDVPNAQIYPDPYAGPAIASAQTISRYIAQAFQMFQTIHSVPSYFSSSFFYPIFVKMTCLLVVTLMLLKHSPVSTYSPRISVWAMIQLQKSFFRLLLLCSTSNLH